MVILVVIHHSSPDLFLLRIVFSYISLPSIAALFMAAQTLLETSGHNASNISDHNASGISGHPPMPRTALDSDPHALSATPHGYDPSPHTGRGVDHPPCGDHLRPAATSTCTNSSHPPPFSLSSPVSPVAAIDHLEALFLVAAFGGMVIAHRPPSSPLHPLGRPVGDCGDDDVNGDGGDDNIEEMLRSLLA